MIDEHPLWMAFVMPSVLGFALRQKYGMAVQNGLGNECVAYFFLREGWLNYGGR
jgi:hypothetical protein